MVEQKILRHTEGILAQVAPGTPGRFVAFDNLLAVAMRALDHDKCHGPLLALGHCHSETQCDITLSRSPLLKPYPMLRCRSATIGPHGSL